MPLVAPVTRAICWAFIGSRLLEGVVVVNDDRTAGILFERRPR